MVPLEKLAGYTNFMSQYMLYLLTTVKPPLSGHPRGKGKWALKRGWPLNRACQKST